MAVLFPLATEQVAEDKYQYVSLPSRHGILKCPQPRRFGRFNVVIGNKRPVNVSVYMIRTWQYFIAGTDDILTFCIRSPYRYKASGSSQST